MHAHSHTHYPASQYSYGSRPELDVEYHFITANKFAEPYRTTSLEAYHSEGDELLSCSWELKQLISDLSQADAGFYAAGVPEEHRGTMDGVSISMEFHAPGQYHVDLSCLGPGGTIEYQKTDRISVYYVRRELRALSTADRERYLDAFKLMGEVDTETGKEVGEGNTRKIHRAGLASAIHTPPLPDSLKMALCFGHACLLINSRSPPTPSTPPVPRSTASTTTRSTTLFGRTSTRPVRARTT